MNRARPRCYLRIGGARQSYPARVTFQWRDTDVPGVLRGSASVRIDPRGTFQELWRQSWTQPRGLPPFVQANLSRSDTGVLRGLHFHRHQTDLWIVLEGTAHVSLVDIRGLLDGREGDPSRLAEVLEPGQIVMIPEGVAHGYWALEPVSLLYLVTNEYDGSDEHGFIWNDPAAAADWPPGDPILSVRDSSAMALRAAVAAAQDLGQSVSR